MRVRGRVWGGGGCVAEAEGARDGMCATHTHMRRAYEAAE